MNIGESNMMVMDHTALISEFGKITIRISKPEKGKIVLRLIRFTGKALANLRTELGLDQVDIANGTELTQAQLSLFENEKQTPKDRHLIALQHFYTKQLGYKVIFYFDDPTDEKKTGPDELWGQKA